MNRRSRPFGRPRSISHTLTRARRNDEPVEREARFAELDAEIAADLRNPEGDAPILAPRRRALKKAFLELLRDDEKWATPGGG